MERKRKSVKQLRAEIISRSKDRHPNLPDSYHRAIAEAYLRGGIDRKGYEYLEG